MLNFSELVPENKTFTKAAGSGKVQAYHNLKFRISVNKKDQARVGKFTFSDTMFTNLELEKNCLKKFNAPNGNVYLMLMSESNEKVKEQDGLILKTRQDKDNKYKKGKSFKNDFLYNDLVANGTLANIETSQFIDLVDVTKEVQNLPSEIIGVYHLVKGADVVEEDEDENAVVAEEEVEEEF